MYSPGPGFGPRPGFGRGGPPFGRGGLGGRGGLMGSAPGVYPGMSFGPPGGDRPPPKPLLDLNTGSGFKRMKGMPSLPGMGKKARKGRGADDPQDPLPISVPELKKKFSESTCITVSILRSFHA